MPPSSSWLLLPRNKPLHLLQPRNHQQATEQQPSDGAGGGCVSWTHRYRPRKRQQRILYKCGCRKQIQYKTHGEYARCQVHLENWFFHLILRFGTMISWSMVGLANQSHLCPPMLYRFVCIVSKSLGWDRTGVVSERDTGDRQIVFLGLCLEQSIEWWENGTPSLWPRE